MGENITKIKVHDDVHCISLDTAVIDTATFGFDSVGKLCVRLGSSMYADTGGTGIGVKIHPDTRNYLQKEPSGLSLKLDSLANDMAGAMGRKLGIAIDGYNNELVIGTQPLKLGTGLTRGDSDKELCLNLGSGLEFGYDETVRLSLDGTQLLLITPSGGPLKFNLERLYELLEARYILTRK